jgi:hypothetical protein
MVRALWYPHDGAAGLIFRGMLPPAVLARAVNSEYVSYPFYCASGKTQDTRFLGTLRAGVGGDA